MDLILPVVLLALTAFALWHGRSAGSAAERGKQSERAIDDALKAARAVDAHRVTGGVPIEHDPFNRSRVHKPKPDKL